MQIEWTRQAIRDLTEIETYIQKDKPAAARQVAAHLASSVEHLAEFPELGKLGPRPGTRELVIPPYIISYRVRSERLEILSIWHGGRGRPKAP
ncbi:MAG: type II toxin-antitoxin system mRNA interferase toxin, RelE/StbE family [Acidobacteria bacterium]|nr:MAG: type II toxin-antitoxin system mRNA interferase toxin, RelE/StbE family [Acidobacteriota bacterium]